MARQAGMDVARGEYMKYVDSDDYLDLEALEICYNEAKKDDVDILVHGAYAFNKNKQWINREFPYQLITEQQFKILCATGAFYMHKTDFIRENRISYYDTGNMSEDQCFNMRCTPVARKIKTIPDILYHYRQHDTSLCATVHGAERAKDHFNNICVAYKYWRNKGFFHKIKRQLIFLNGP